MPPVQIDLVSCLYAAQSAAMQAGHCIMSYFGRELSIDNKGFGYEKSDLVTQADQHAQRIIEDILYSFHPDIAFLAEENGHHSNEDRFEKPYFWSIDPLDGTKAFIHQNPGFAVSIGLVDQSGNAILGVCFFPATNRLYWGYDKIAYRNDTQIKKTNTTNELRILLSEAESLPELKNRFYHRLCDRMKSEHHVKKIKAETLIAPVEKGIQVIDTDIPTIYYGLPRAELGVSVWDFAAIAAIANAAGIHCSDLFGKALELNRSGSTFMHHNGFLMASDHEYAKTVISCFTEFQSELKEHS